MRFIFFFKQKSSISCLANAVQFVSNTQEINSVFHNFLRKLILRIITPHAFLQLWLFFKVIQGNLQQKNWDLKSISTDTTSQLPDHSKTINLKLF